MQPTPLVSQLLREKAKQKRTIYATPPLSPHPNPPTKRPTSPV